MTRRAGLLLAVVIGIIVADNVDAGKRRRLRRRRNRCTPCCSTATPAQGTAEKADADTIVMFNGRDLDGWKVTDFGGQGEVHVKDGALVLDFGSDMTGITWTRDLPRVDYEVSLEAQRVDGSDFFCGLTFPVEKAPCSLIIGGWGGGVCGLSSLDGMDASENETTSYKEFKKGQWYRIRLRVTRTRIQAWLDDEQIVDQDIKGRKLDIRYEVELSKPFGFATWQTTGALRKIVMRKLSASELSTTDDSAASESGQ